MQTVQRSGVEFDICPTCRGIWLDRGELEKLLDTARADDSGGRPAGPYHGGNDDDRPPARAYGRRDDDEDHRRKKRRSSIFDIFD
jgi:Zn-finger nucleic acid-binding protein